MGDESNSTPEREDIPKLQPIRRPFNVTALSVLGLFILALFYTFYFASDFLLPVIFAWILSMLLKPLVRLLTRAHIPEALGAALVLAIVVAIVGLGLFSLSGPATAWMKRAPESIERVEGKVRAMLNSATPLKEAAQTVEHLANGTADETPKVELKKPGVLNSLLSQTRSVVIMGAEVFVLLFFFLAAGDVFMLKLIQVLPKLRDKKRAVEIVRETEKGISQYLGAITLVNLYEGTAIGIGLGLLGLPNPVLWGVLAFVANYVPYLGALIAGSIVTIVALVSFDSVGRALIAPAIYFGVNFTDNFISPYVMGRRLVLNPVIVFLAVMFWGWIWGIVGVLLAVPITMVIKIVCDHSTALAPFAEFLTGPKPENSSSPPDAIKPSYAKGNA